MNIGYAVILSFHDQLCKNIKLKKGGGVFYPSFLLKSRNPTSMDALMVFIIIIMVIPATIYRVECPNFGHLALTSAFTKYNIFHIVLRIVNGLSLLKLFHLSNGDSLFS